MNEKLKKQLELMQNADKLAQNATKLTQNANEIAKTVTELTQTPNIFMQSFKTPLLSEAMQSFKTPLLSEAMQSFKTPLFLENIQSMTQLAKTNQEIAESVRISAQLNFNFTSPITEIFKELHQNITAMTQNMFKNFDWSAVRESLRRQLEYYDSQLEQFDKELWAIDADILDAFEEAEIELSSAIIEKHVEDSLESYIELFVTDELYSDHKLIIEQAYSAYKNADYALTAFPLFAVIDRLISNTFAAYEIDTKLKPSLKSHKNKTYHKVKDYVETTEDEIAFYLMFFRRVFNVYKKMFEPSWKNHPKQINRNWIMHGSFTYDSITKVDALKLFQLIKAIEVVKSISFEQDKQEVS
ncbi:MULTISPECIES: hypothetical protein [Bacillus cereus group]|uniref:hypothetical protein n=1 Tax=Bacillus TaxID=1386 RepID=UPI000BECF877|nr:MULTISPECIES: hypothetical protein [Bacillus cereus group]PEF24966.1 hypothetical protein CON69_10445 [Bacillus pseudomycoides]PGD77071.1 hypothetical protein COM46_08520 [Bacillus pseudomycoides]WCT65418.1 hypothetical protein PRK74_06310 [Bacillus cereus]